MRGPSAFTAGLTVVVVVAAQLGAHAHAAASRHVTCEEHGEQLEAPLVAEHQDDGVARWLAVETASGDHDACLLAAALTQSGITSAPAPVLPELAALSIDASEPSPAAPFVVAVYRLAPKTSPPIAG